MAWLTLSQLESRTFLDIVGEIESGSPRAVAIVAGAFVEQHLTKVIRWRLVKEMVKSDVDLQEQMFRAGDPLGDFGNKINLAYLMGIISKDAWKEVDAIRFIRNEFAQKGEISDWDFDQIKCRCEALILWENTRIKFHVSSGKRQHIITLGTDVQEDGEHELPLNLIEFASAIRV